MAERTPGPWEVREESCIVSIARPDLDDWDFYDHQDGDCRWVAETATSLSSDPHSHANAAFIVKAVNMHDRLLVALQGLDEASELIRHAWDQEDAYRIFEQAQQNARTLLAEAGEQRP